MEEPTCSLIEGDIHRKDILVADEHHRARVVSLDNQPVGPFLSERVGQETKVCLLPHLDIVVLGQDKEETISAYEVRTGRRVWGPIDIDELYDISCFANDKLLVVQLNGRCTQVNALDGRPEASLTGISRAWTDSGGARALIMHEERGRNVKLRLLELRTDLRRPPVFTTATDFSFSGAHRAFGEGWMALTEHQFGTLVCWNDDGTERWRFAQGDERPAQHTTGFEKPFFFFSISPTPNGRQIFGLLRSKDRGVPNEGILFDASDGRIVSRVSIPNEHIANVPVMDGQLLVAHNGLLQVPEGKFESRRYAV